jgi:signal recognition particle receptor subunit beta
VSDSDLVTKQRKKTTTVAMDHDVVQLENGDTINVFGTPGQERFDFMWDILSQGAHGIVLLLDNTRNYPFRDLKFYTERFSKLIGNSRLIVGITHTDINKELSVEAYRNWLNELEIKAEVFAVDARKGDQVLALLYKLLGIANQDVSLPIGFVDNKVQKTESRKFSVRSFLDKLKFESRENFSDISRERTLEIDKKALAEIASIEGVRGISLLDSEELLHSTIDDEQTNEFLKFITGIASDISTDLDRGNIHRIMLRSPDDDNLMLFLEQEKSLGIISKQHKSIQVLSQQIEDKLQWL